MVTTDAVTILSAPESWDLLAGAALGRLVTCVDNEPDIFPVNFAVHGRTVLFRTGEGTKLVSSAINNRVLFEADGHDAEQGWSVIIKGTARMLRTRDQIDEADLARLVPWTATLKQHWVRVLPVGITGRRFRFGPEPDPASAFA